MSFSLQPFHGFNFSESKAASNRFSKNCCCVVITDPVLRAHILKPRNPPGKLNNRQQSQAKIAINYKLIKSNRKVTAHTYIGMMQYLETDFPTRNKSIKTDFSLQQKLKNRKRGGKKNTSKTNQNQQNTKPTNKFH